MPKYMTDPNIMNKDLGVVASGALSAPQTSAAPQTPTGLPTVQQPTGLTAPGVVSGGIRQTEQPAQDMSQCHPCTAKEIMFPSKYGVRIVTGTGTRPMCCPKTVGEVTRRPGVEGGTEGTGLGEFGWPQEMQDLYQLYMSRGSELLGSPGFSDQAMSYAFGNDFEKIRQQEAGKRQQMMDYQSKSGMLGTGSGAEQMMDLAWGTEGDIATLMRDIFLQNEGQKRTDIGLGGNIFGGGMDFAKSQEAINAARRGEGTQALALLLNWLQTMKG